MLGIIKKIFKSENKELKKAWDMVEIINGMSSKVEKMSKEELRESTKYFREKLGVDLENIPDIKIMTQEEKEREVEKLFGILPEVFARVREVSYRVAKHRHYDVQLIGGIMIAKNKVAELFTGEGKTLLPPLAGYLYALTGRSVHVVTVNDYLTKRDAEWVGHILDGLGMTVSTITSSAAYKYVNDQEILESKAEEDRDELKKRLKLKDLSVMASLRGANLKEITKKEAYLCDIVYGTSSEFGFDYLRDNMVSSLDRRVQRGHYFAIVDECDSILIDEARTPLIISAPASKSNELYARFAQIAKTLKDDVDYTVDEKDRNVFLTEDGIKRVEKLTGVINLWENFEYVHHLENALKAETLFKKDVDYLVRSNQVFIVDQFTGRVLPGRRYSEGLHQAIEAKEGVEVKKESKTMATISYQNYFRMYEYLSGMTGTALTEAEEFADIYNLDVVVVPTVYPVIRVDTPDVIYKTRVAKFSAVVEQIKKIHEEGRPILVGTTSIENSEYLSDLLKKKGLKHSVLNAKQHEKEAMIVAEAGKKGSITVATNMAGRGTDIKISKDVRSKGGLHIIGTERHESRRIDNQLRGRSGRLGDPGSSGFFVSLEDELMIRFGGEVMSSIFNKLGISEDVPIESSMISRAIEQAQKRVENTNFEIRKRLVEYDDVLNKHRSIIYSLRETLLYYIDQEVKTIRKRINKGESTSDIVKSVRISDIDMNDLINWLSEFSILEKETWGNKYIKDSDFVFNVVRMWILQKILRRSEKIIRSSFADDSKIDNDEKEQLIKDFESMIPSFLQNKVFINTKYKSVTDLFEKIKIVNISAKVLEVQKFLINMYIEFIQELQLSFVDLQRNIILSTIDKLWTEHLDSMSLLREGISLRSIAQKDPLTEYKNEGFSMFKEMLNDISDSIAVRVFKVRRVEKKATNSPKRKLRDNIVTKAVRDLVSQQNSQTTKGKVGRNDPCPCGSGKKYKKCCYPKFE